MLPCLPTAANVSRSHEQESLAAARLESAKETLARATQITATASNTVYAFELRSAADMSDSADRVAQLISAEPGASNTPRSSMHRCRKPRMADRTSAPRTVSSNENSIIGGILFTRLGCQCASANEGAWIAGRGNVDRTDGGQRAGNHSRLYGRCHVWHLLLPPPLWNTSC